MFVHYRTKGIILKKENRGEADQLFTIYTEDFGKIDVLAKSIRKIDSKLRSGAELFYFSEIEFIQGKNNKKLTDAILINNFKNIKEDLKRLSIANKVSVILNGVIRGQERDDQIWVLLLEIFEKLNNRKIEDKNIFLIFYYFTWNLLNILGYQIDLYNCVFCQEKLIPEKLSFSSEDGGIICNKCSKNIKDKTIVLPEIIKILRIIVKKHWKILERIKIDENLQKILKIITQQYSNIALSEKE